MKNRMLPLGYKMSNGEIVIDEIEAEVVKGIFVEYCKGSPLSVLIEALNAKDSIFKESVAQWNKGRLHHIIVDERYLGNGVFSQIIDKETFDKAHSIMESKRVRKRQMPNEIEYLKGKVYCEKCGGKFKRIYDSNKKERWVCENGCKFGKRPTDESIVKSAQQIFEKVFLAPKLLLQTLENVGYKQTTEIMRLTNEIARMNDQNTPSFKTGKTLLFQLASVKFSACKEDKSVYSDFVFEEIKRAIGSGGIDVKLLRNTVHKVLIMGKDEYAIKFANGAVITNKEESIDASKISNED